MSIAVTIDPRDQVRPDPLEHGVVAVFGSGFANFAAACSCGWTGRRRFFKSAAQLDAWEHSMDEKCQVSVPLVVPVAA
jgi:hypothetical protein